MRALQGPLAKRRDGAHIRTLLLSDTLPFLVPSSQLGDEREPRYGR